MELLSMFAYLSALVQTISLPAYHRYWTSLTRHYYCICYTSPAAARTPTIVYIHLIQYSDHNLSLALLLNNSDFTG